jgi:hypothetical protein
MENILSENMRRFKTKNLNEDKSEEFTISDWDIANNPEEYLGDENLVDDWLSLFDGLDGLADRYKYKTPDDVPEHVYISLANNFLNNNNSDYRVNKKISQNKEGEIEWKMRRVRAPKWDNPEDGSPKKKISYTSPNATLDYEFRMSPSFMRKFAFKIFKENGIDASQITQQHLQTFQRMIMYSYKVKLTKELADKIDKELRKIDLGHTAENYFDNELYYFSMTKV